MRPGLPAEPPPERPEAAEPAAPSLPEGLEVASADGSTILIWRGSALSGAFFFAIGLLSLMAGLWMAVSPTSRDPATAVFLLVVGASFGWPGLARLLNRTEIVVDGREVRVWTGPIPVDLPRGADLAEVAFFSVGRHVRLNRRSDRGLWGAVSGGPTRQDVEQSLNMPWSRVIVTWEVLAVGRDQSETRLVRGLPSHEVARTVVQVLAEYLPRT